MIALASIIDTVQSRLQIARPDVAQRVQWSSWVIQADLRNARYILLITMNTFVSSFLPGKKTAEKLLTLIVKPSSGLDPSLLVSSLNTKNTRSSVLNESTNSAPLRNTEFNL